MDIYARNILDHYQRPRCRRKMAGADASCRELNRSCGDDMTVFVKMKGDIIQEISFEGNGCAISVATISILSEELVGKTKAELLAMDLPDLQELLGIHISARRSKCALIGLRALQKAVTSLENKS
ncbi:iron-sulfur cluster assembly scaffold protein [Patescibacteria group bacterium]|nr:iron-sulfur cluster assembly scaffold protein [Patescibacteria group bacterium]